MFFLALLCYLVSLVVSVQIFRPFLNWVVCFLIVELKSYLYILVKSFTKCDLHFKIHECVRMTFYMFTGHLWFFLCSAHFLAIGIS